MEVKIKAIHFDVSEKLEEFISKKVEKLCRHHEEISVADVTLKVVKPETAMNKEAGIKLILPTHEDLFASKTADTFEEAIDLAIDALKRQLEKTKKDKK
ncbi:MAG: ribosome-associated translation inhibitor RaiA [Muribaculaceae bacterium]|jgi:putative sigma-54 modulation protein|nr:ribosome-associated translation inhibitor RaiA [Muribaculaceae bacterium]